MSSWIINMVAKSISQCFFLGAPGSAGNVRTFLPRAVRTRTNHNTCRFFLLMEKCIAICGTFYRYERGVSPKLSIGGHCFRTSSIFQKYRFKFNISKMTDKIDKEKQNSLRTLELQELLEADL